MSSAKVDYPMGFGQILKLSDKEFAQELKFMAAAKFYELGRLSSGKAAELAGMSRIVFLSRLHEMETPALLLSAEEIDAEIQAARELAG